MATSGTTNFNLNLTELIEEAFERAGAELRSGYDFRTARRSLNLLTIEWANRGVNLWTIEQGVIPLVQGTATYNLPVDTIDIIDQVIRTQPGQTNNQSDITITRVAVGTYSAIPNKLVQGRPIQVWVDRTVTPSVTVWPVPDQSSTYQFVYWRMRRMQDAGNGPNTIDIPFRFLPCLVAGLAYYIAMKIPEGAPRIDMLKQSYMEQWDLAAGEDRDRASVMVVPRQVY